MGLSISHQAIQLLIVRKTIQRKYYEYSNHLTGYISEWLGVVAVLYMLTRLSKLKLRVTKFQAPQKEKRPSLIVSGALLLISFTFFAFFIQNDIIP